MRGCAGRASLALVAAAGSVLLVVIVLFGIDDGSLTPGGREEEGAAGAGSVAGKGQADREDGAGDERRERVSAGSDQSAGAPAPVTGIAGQVVTESGQALAGAWVEARAMLTGDLLGETTTAATGRFVLEFPARPARAGPWIRIEARHDGHAPEMVTALLGSSVTLALTPAVTLSLTVLDQDDGTPVQGVRIAIDSLAGSITAGPPTDEAGHATCALPARLEEFLLERAGYRSARKPGWIGKPGDSIARTVSLERAPTHFVAVVDLEGRDIPDPIFETTHAYERVAAEVVRRIAGPPLRHEVRIEHSSLRNLRVRAPGFAARTLYVAEDESRALDQPPLVVTLGRGATLIAHASRDGGPCAAEGTLELLGPGVEDPVTADSWPVVFRPDGRFHVDGLPRDDAEYRIAVWFEDSAVRRLEFVIGREQEVLDLGTFDLGSDEERLRGGVRDEAGLPVAGASVRLFAGAWSASTVTDSGGGYRLAPADGPCLLEVAMPGYCTHRETLDPLPRTAQDVILARGGVVSGRVVDDQGDPVGFSWIHWSSLDESSYARGAALADAGGEFRVEGICAGSISLNAWRTGYLASPYVSGVTAGSNVTLVTGRAGLLRVRALSSQRLPLHGPWCVMVTADGHAYRKLDAGAGETEVVTLRHAGPVGVRLHIEGFAVAARTAWVEPLGETVVDLMVAGGHEVLLSIVDQDGAPRAGLGLSLVHRDSSETAFPFALPLQHAETDAEGRARFRLAPGRYGLVATSGGERLDRELIDVAGPVDVVIRCLPTSPGSR